MASGSTVNKLVKGSLALTLAGVIINLLQTFSTIIVAWYLSPEDYGLVAIVMTFMTIITAVTNMQLGEALIRQENPGEQEINTVWTLGMLRGIVMALFFVATAWPVAHFYNDPRLGPMMYALALSPLLMGLQNPMRFLQQRNLVFRQEFLITVLQKVAGFACTVGIAAVWKTYWALIIGNTVFYGAGTLISFILMRYRPRFTLKGVKEIFGFSVWITLGEIINTLNWRFEFLLIGKILGMAPLGIYNMGSNLAQLPTAETMKPLKKVIYPGFTGVLNDPNGTPERLRSAYQRAQGTVTLIALPVGVGFALLSDPLVRLVLSERWYPVIPILQYLSAVFAFQTLGSLVQPLGWAKGRTRWLFVRDTWMFFLRLPLIITGMMIAGLPGVVVARIITGLIATVFNMFLVQRLIDLPVLEQLRVNLRALASIVLAAVAAALLSMLFDGATANRIGLFWQICTEGAGGLFIYIACNSLFWRLAGRPEGPETEIHRIVCKLVTRRRLNSAKA